MHAALNRCHFFFSARLLIIFAALLPTIGVYYCESHTSLTGAYYFFLEGFTADELRAQRSKLEMV